MVRAIGFSLTFLWGMAATLPMETAASTLMERIKAGEPLVIAHRDASIPFSYVDVGLKLDVEPTIYLDGDVAIKISLEVSSIISQLQTKGGSVAYEIGTRTAQTVLRLRDGENQILAGLINDEDRRSGNRVPGLGDIPVVGRLFGDQTDNGQKTEIVLSITPRIVRNVHRPDPSLLEFDSGTDSVLGVRGAGAPIAPPGVGELSPSPSPQLVPAPPSPSPPPNAAPATSGLPPGGAPADAQSAAVSNSSPISIAGGAVAAAPAQASVAWQGPGQVKAGDTFALQFLLNSSQPLVSVPFALGFDPQVLQVVSVVQGDFMRQGGVQAAFSSRVDPKGQVIGTATRSGDTGAAGQGAIATVNFRATTATTAQTQVRLITVAPVGLAGAQVPVAVAQPFGIQIVPGS